MRKMTNANLEAAFAGESMAYMKYMIFAERAKAEGFDNISRLFEAIAHAERVHATNHFRALSHLGKSTDNLQAAIDGETYEVDEMYPAFGAVAELQDEKAAMRSISYALEAEKIHARMYGDAKRAAEANADIEIGQVHICEVCGYTGFDEAPDKCPVCNAKREMFKLF